MKENNYLGSLAEPLKRYVFVAKKIIPKQLCEFVLQDEKKSDKSWDTHHWSHYEDGKLASHVKDTKEDSFKVKPCENKDLFECVRKSVELYEQIYNFEGMIKFVSPIRINRYLTGTEMKSHYDHIYSLFDGEKKGVPILSVVGLLNDNFSGGEFHFYDFNVPLEAGDILIFPSSFMYPHGVRKVTGGERWSFVNWCH